MTDHLRIRGLLNLHKIIQRNQFPSIGFQIVLSNVLRLGAVASFGLNVYAVGPIVEIKIVHVHRSHVDLQRVSNLCEWDL